MGINPALLSRFDSMVDGGATFLARELDQVFADVYRAELTPLNAMRDIPQIGGIDPGAQTFTRKMYTPSGKARIISDHAADLPRADVTLTSVTHNVRTGAIGYGYTVDEMMAAGRLGVRLETERGAAARRAVEELMNDIAWFGSRTYGLFGFLSHPYIPRTTLTITSASDPDVIAAAIHGLSTSVTRMTKNAERPSRLVCCSQFYQHIASTRMADGSDTTILRHILNTAVNIREIVQATELDDQGTSGFGVVALITPTAMKGGQAVPLNFTQRAPQDRALSVLVPCHARLGGYATSYPLAHIIAEFAAEF